MIRLLSLEIQNFRSIVGETVNINFNNFTAIVGPNNSGKSNIVRALNLLFCGTSDRHPYTTELDYPKSDSLTKGDQTKITITLSFEPKKEVIITRALDELEANSNQFRLDDNIVTLRLSYSKHGSESWQFIGKKGSKNIDRTLTEKVRDAVRQSVVFKYIPVERDSLDSINKDIGIELIQTIFSGWQGASRTRKEINDAIETLLNRLHPELETSSTDITGNVKEVFREIKQLKFILPFSNLEEMLPNLTAVISDTAETGLQSKGAGIQTSSLIFLLKYLADNRPQRYNSNKTFIWAIEEPESFLHPAKQREMAGVMSKFASAVQTVVTTHCPHFVLRDTASSSTYVIDKHAKPPHGTIVVGNDFDIARQSLGVSLLDSMLLFPHTVIVEGPSDEILFAGALKKLNKYYSIPAYDVKFIPAGNASSASYLFESIKQYNDTTTTVQIVLDGDNAGHNALQGLLGRGKRDGVSYKANVDYFVLPLDVENLLPMRIKTILADERPGQVDVVKNIDDKITSFGFSTKHKKSLAERSVDLFRESDLAQFKKLFDKMFPLTSTQRTTH